MGNTGLWGGSRIHVAACLLGGLPEPSPTLLLAEAGGTGSFNAWFSDGWTNSEI